MVIASINHFNKVVVTTIIIWNITIVVNAKTNNNIHKKVIEIFS